MRHIEDGIQQAIIAYLRICCPQVIACAIPNGGYRNPREAARLKTTGVLAGIPDILIVGKAGQAYFLEVKAAKGKLSPAQKDIHAQLETLGAPIATVRSVDDVRAALREWGVQTRENWP